MITIKRFTVFQNEAHMVAVCIEDDRVNSQWVARILLDAISTAISTAL